MKYTLHFAVTLILLLTWSNSIIGQSPRSLSILITDAATGEPVENAFVFYSGSSVGGISDENGAVKLDRKLRFDLLVSHLNYESKVIPAESVLHLTKTTISLAPRVLKINEVTVTSSDKYKAKRKRWLKRFGVAFLGSRRDRKQVRILNPEVILFEEIEAGLRVETIDRIKIENDELGYELSFLLDTFLLTKQDDVFYGGKVFFQDKISAKGGWELNWKKARRKSFETSKAHFFSQLVRADLDEEQYEIGLTQFTTDLEYVGYKKMTASTLNMRKGIIADTLVFTGFLTVTKRKIITQYGTKSVYNVKPDEYATSFLRSNSGRFIISPSGVLLNNHEVEELGYWSKNRVAKLLPTNYLSDLAENYSPRINNYLDSLHAYQRSVWHEKVYLHLDKPYYSISDNLWFKVYLLDAATHRHSTQSAVVYVDLIGPTGKVVQTRTLHREQFLGGDFTFRPLQKPGIYHLRAYTNNMRNAGEQYFFQRMVPVYDPTNFGNGSLMGTQLRTEEEETGPETQFPFLIRLHSEGGTLVAGLENTVIIQLIDSLRMPLLLSGNIIDQSDHPITPWTTDSDGWGQVQLQPGVDKDYWIEVPYDGKVYRVPLPPVANKGAVLHVNNTSIDKVTCKVSANLPQVLDGAFLIGHTRGEAFCKRQRLIAGEEIVFSRTQIPAGVASLALFDKSGKLLATRLFFNEQTSPKTALSITTPYAFFRPRQEVVVDLSWADSLQEQGASLSVSVTDRSTVYHEQAGENVRNYLQLKADFPVSVNYVKNDQGMANPEKWLLLDLQLAATTHERFGWENVLRSKEKTLTHPREIGSSLEGYVTNKNKPEERIKAEVMLTALHPQPILKKVITDEDGSFRFTDLPYLDTIDYILQAARFDPKKSTEAIVLTSTKRKVDIQLKEQVSTPPLGAKKEQLVMTSLPDHILQRFALVGEENSRLDSLYGADWQIDLAEITVSTQRRVDSRNYDVFDLNRLDWVPPEKPAYGLLTTLKPGNQYVRELSHNTLQAVVNDGLGKMIRVPVRITIDGFDATFTRFESLRANMIDYIFLSKTSIQVTTRSKPRSATTKSPDGLLTVRHPGFYPGRAFPAPNYTQSRAEAEKADLRSTLHWEPNFRLDAQGQARISFYAADTPTEYEIRIEGITDAGEPVFKTFVITIAD